MSSAHATPAAYLGSNWFTTTHWSVVLAAGDSGSDEAQKALEELCRKYWRPLYAFARRKGYQDAEDLVQGFLARLLEREDLAKIAREKGRFRTFLQVSFDHFAAEIWGRQRAVKRGGKISFVSFESPEAGESPTPETLSAQELYDLRWARTVFKVAGEKLAAEYAQSGQAQLFERLRSNVTGETKAAAYSNLAEHTGRPIGTVKSDVSKMRKRFRALIYEQVAATVGDPMEIEPEARYLIGLVGRGGTKSQA